MNQIRAGVYLLVFVEFLGVAQNVDPSRPTAFTAYVTFQSRSTDDPSGKVTSYYLYAVRSDGSTLRRAVDERGVLSDVDVASVTSLSEASQVRIDYLVKLKSSMPMTIEDVKSRNDAIDPLCADRLAPTPTRFAYLSPENALGMDSRKYLLDDDYLRITEWRVPALNCFAVKRIWEIKDKTGVIAEETEEAVVTLGEPPADLFQIPPFDEVKPSELEKRRIQQSRPDMPVSESMLMRWKRWDAAYEESHRLR
jgi:hypothetical protein